MSNDFQKNLIAKEKRKAYYKKNKEKIIAKNLDYQSFNKEKIKEYQKEYYNKNSKIRNQKNKEKEEINIIQSYLENNYE